MERTEMNKEEKYSHFWRGVGIAVIVGWSFWMICGIVLYLPMNRGNFLPWAPNSLSFIVQLWMILTCVCIPIGLIKGYMGSVEAPEPPHPAANDPEPETRGEGVVVAHFTGCRFNGKPMLETDRCLCHINGPFDTLPTQG